mmetsp:Transcript_26430/g.19812  ORF Transcript_26430/g.19812 Transcript_26430/m.19812 type:complete len:148 (-) Transcript_26430:186-629(-)
MCLVVFFNYPEPQSLDSILKHALKVKEKFKDPNALTSKDFIEEPKSFSSQVPANTQAQALAQAPPLMVPEPQKIENKRLPILSSGIASKSEPKGKEEIVEPKKVDEAKKKLDNFPFISPLSSKLSDPLSALADKKKKEEEVRVVEPV